MYLLGIDIGSSSVKVSLIEAQTGQLIASAFSPKVEMEIEAKQTGWAEQNPYLWWKHLKIALAETLSLAKVSSTDIKALGISYQMHGLVCLDANGEVLRPSIIWCDSRAVEIGNKAFQNMGKEKCLQNLLNSPGNFTASKLMWVKLNEPSLYEKIHKVMLPGDYIAYKLTGEFTTTSTGLSEGILWDFQNNQLSNQILSVYQFPASLFPSLVPIFGNQGAVMASAAQELGLAVGTIVAYRAGDQPNNALSLNVLNPGEVAATAGTSGVVYGVSDIVKYDPLSRVNTFVHVNHRPENPRFGVLLCVNGTGILNSWLRNNILSTEAKISYDEMNELASLAPVGADGISVMPFGNGAERMLENKALGAHFIGLQFNKHKSSHIIRAAQEGIVFALRYGIDQMKQLGVKADKVRAGMANMFLSPIFAETFATVCKAEVQLYNTDGAQGAARGAGLGLGYYASFNEAFQNLKSLKTIHPNTDNATSTEDAYQRWVENLEKLIR
jgi:xylulokinase